MRYREMMQQEVGMSRPKRWIEQYDSINQSFHMVSGTITYEPKEIEEYWNNLLKFGQPEPRAVVVKDSADTHDSKYALSYAAKRSWLNGPVASEPSAS